MSSIDDIKDKLTDMEYKNICDKLMDLHKQFKEQPIVEPVMNYDSSDDEEPIVEPSDDDLREKLSQWYVPDVEHKLQERMSEYHWVEMREKQWMFNKLLPIRIQLERDLARFTGRRYNEQQVGALYAAYHEKEVGFMDEVHALSDELKQEYYQRFYVSDFDSDIDL